MTRSAITAQVLAANQRFYDALEALDIAAMEACWSPAPGVACLHPGMPWQRGWDEVSSGWEVIRPFRFQRGERVRMRGAGGRWAGQLTPPVWSRIRSR